LDSLAGARVATLSDEQRERYATDGFVLIESVFDEEEISALRRAFAEDATVRGPHRVTEDDGETVRTGYASHTRHPIFATLARSSRLLEPARTIVGDDVYVYQVKVNTKRPLGGGSWSWHQDYIVWRDADDLPAPALVNVAVFLDDVTEYNGPVIFLTGSHRRGTVERTRSATRSSQYIDPDGYLLTRAELTEMARSYPMASPKGEAGGVLFFHPEIVHGSAANISPQQHDLLIITYNAVGNLPRHRGVPGPDHLVARDTGALVPHHDRLVDPANPGRPDGASLPPPSRPSPHSARAAVLERFGAPLAIRELRLPEPAEGELVVDVSYGGICGTDVHLQQGHLAVPTPIVLGHEGLGRVRSMGSAMTDRNGDPLQVGDAVMWASSISCGRCVHCVQHREPTLCTARRTYGVNRVADDRTGPTGSWSQAMLLHDGATVVRLPEGVDPIAAMSLACAGPTVVHALRDRLLIRLGETVIVQGSGPVGLAAAALARLAGAVKVIIVGGPEQRLKLARECGIGDEHLNVVNADDPEPVLRRAMELARGGADTVIECAGVPAAVAQGLRLARRGGSYLVIGQYTDAGDTTFNPHQIVYRQLNVVGSWAFTGAHLIEYVNLLPRLAERFDLARLVTVYPLADAERAVRAVARGEAMKAVLDGTA
jgi:threonine dehydrogenase-like Zn-dependent dehydrogenase/ectoine hydroxylase-related dioxygenase (phytanoyl-CoA dioxygenase family)